jgi:hypothetical protein
MESTYSPGPRPSLFRRVDEHVLVVGACAPCLVTEAGVVPSHLLEILVRKPATDDRCNGVVERWLRRFLVGAAHVVVQWREAMALAQPANVSVVPDFVRSLEDRGEDGVKQNEEAKSRAKD